MNKTETFCEAAKQVTFHLFGAAYTSEQLEIVTALQDLILQDVIAFPDHKPAAKAYIDDRGIRFEGEWFDIETLRTLMTPWYGGSV